MDYFIVERETVQELIEAVNNLLEKNWKLQGGVSTYYVPSLYKNAIYCQAMVYGVKND